METEEFPIGESLIAVSIVEDQEFSGDELCIDQVELFFPDTKITLLPIADTDEIEILQQAETNTDAVDTPLWCQSLISKKLMMVWICDNNQGYQDQVIFAFDSLHPSITFISEGSVLKVFRSQQISKYRNNKSVQASKNYVAQAALNELEDVAFKTSI
ncbi:DUF6334 family protein [Nostoc sp. TCL26-01]|uniref:DUF6334 family protein n=1 Tax=Nostoc sp. TCL26-01 TaxID=2576904 RepID=UPI0015BD2C35|nr:DUF6334 family protein [Nostoc sp. TCL26-01]QLE58117.1 hypothetical protein FD725_22935 [Nostoc sp. TCL26-01]